MGMRRAKLIASEWESDERVVNYTTRGRKQEETRAISRLKGRDPIYTVLSRSGSEQAGSEGRNNIHCPRYKVKIERKDNHIPQKEKQTKGIMKTTPGSEKHSDAVLSECVVGGISERS